MQSAFDSAVKQVYQKLRSEYIRINIQSFEAKNRLMGTIQFAGSNLSEEVEKELKERALYLVRSSFSAMLVEVSMRTSEQES